MEKKTNNKEKITNTTESRIFKTTIDVRNIDYSQEYAQEKIAVTTPARLRLAQKALVIAKNDDNCETVEQAVTMVGIRPSTWDKWVVAEPELREINDDMKIYLGIKREVLMARGERTSAVKSYMHTYGTRWAKSDEYHAELRKKADQMANADFMDQVEKYAQAREVILKELPASGMVPKKKTPEEVAGAQQKDTGSSSLRGKNGSNK